MKNKQYRIRKELIEQLELINKDINSAIYLLLNDKVKSIGTVSKCNIDYELIRLILKEELDKVVSHS